MSKGLLPDFTPLRVSRGFRLLFASQTITALGAQATEVAVLEGRVPMSIEPFT